MTHGANRGSGENDGVTEKDELRRRHTSGSRPDARETGNKSEGAELAELTGDERRESPWGVVIARM